MSELTNLQLYVGEANSSDALPGHYLTIPGVRVNSASSLSNQICTRCEQGWRGHDWILFNFGGGPIAVLDCSEQERH